MADVKELEFEIIDDQCIKICGIKYSMALFQWFGFAPVGSVIEIMARSEDGMVIIRKHFQQEATIKDAARYRFIRQSEAALGPEAELILAAVWKHLSQKGIDKARMDAIIDDGIKQSKEIDDGG
jgi:hypothetical protein